MGTGHVCMATGHGNRPAMYNRGSTWPGHLTWNCTRCLWKQMGRHRNHHGLARCYAGRHHSTGRDRAAKWDLDCITGLGSWWHCNLHLSRLACCLIEQLGCSIN